MPTSYTKLTLWNAALDHVGEYPLTSVSQESAYARWMGRRFEHVVQAALRANVWGFSCELHTLSASVTVPEFRWLYQYDLPNGWLRVLPLTGYGERGGALIPHEVKDNVLMTDEPAPLHVEIIMDRQDPAAWDPLFAEYIAAQLGYGLARRFTKLASSVKDAQEAVSVAYMQAEQAGAFEGTAEPIEQHDIIRVRG